MVRSYQKTTWKCYVLRTEVGNCQAGSFKYDQTETWAEIHLWLGTHPTAAIPQGKYNKKLHGYCEEFSN